MEEIKAVAKAVEKTAEFGTQALQTGEKAGGFFARVFKEPIESVAGILSDRLRYIRLKRWDEIADEVNDILRRRGITETRPVHPKLGIPLLEHAALEDDPELQRLWSRLLANAMDPEFNEEIRAAYTEIIKNLSPLDAKFLFLLHNSLRRSDRLGFQVADHCSFHANQICAKLNASPESYAISANNLMRLQCIAPHIKRVKLGGGLKIDSGNGYLSTDAGIEEVVMTPLGIRFVEACTDTTIKEDGEAVGTRYDSRLTIDTTYELRAGRG